MKINIKKEEILKKLDELYFLNHSIESEIERNNNQIINLYNKKEALEKTRDNLSYWIETFSQGLTKKEREKLSEDLKNKFNKLKNEAIQNASRPKQN